MDDVLEIFPSLQSSNSDRALVLLTARILSRTLSISIPQYRFHTLEKQFDLPRLTISLLAS